MEFHDSMSFEMRMKNLCRLTPVKEMVAVMSNEYSKLYSESEEKTFETLWKYTTDFQEKFYRKKRLKKKLKFWKSNSMYFFVSNENAVSIKIAYCNPF